MIISKYIHTPSENPCDFFSKLTEFDRVTWTMVSVMWHRERALNRNDSSKVIILKSLVNFWDFG